MLDAFVVVNPATQKGVPASLADPNPVTKPPPLLPANSSLLQVNVVAFRADHSAAMKEEYHK